MREGFPRSLSNPDGATLRPYSLERIFHGTHCEQKETKTCNFVALKLNFQCRFGIKQKIFSAQFLAKQSELLPDGWYSIKLHGFALSCPCYFGETVTGRLNFVSANEEQTRRRGRFRIQRNVDGSVSIFSGKQSKYLQLSDGELMFSSPSSDFPGSKFELESLYTARDIIHIRSLESDEFIGLIKMDNTLKIRMKSESKAKTLFKFERVFMK